jgi:protein TonB
MKTMMFLMLLCLPVGEAGAQAKKPLPSKNAAVGKSSSNNTEDKIVCYFPPMPGYKDGGSEGLMRFIAANTRYPTGHKVSGRVFISFVVTETGKVTDVRLQKGLGKPFDEEAVRVVKLLGDFTPYLEQGVPRRIPFTVPVFFPLKMKAE